MSQDSAFCKLNDLRVAADHSIACISRDIEKLRRVVAQEVTRAVATGPEAAEAAAYEIRECMTRALVDWSHIGETWIVRAGESRARGVIEVYNGAIDGRPGDTIELRSAATGRRVWRVVDRLHSVDDRCLTLWVEPT